MLTLSDTDRRVLTARQVSVAFGADLLDSSDQRLADISSQLAGGEVQRDNYAAVHGSCDLEVLGALDWPNVRVRPWQAVTAPGVGTVRANLGVYVLTTPEQNVTDDDTTTYAVQGYDKLHLLQHAVGDTYVVPAGTGYLAAARQAIADAGVTGLPALFDGTAQDKVLAAPMVWVLDPGTLTTWLGVVNDLLAAIGYRGLWADGDGRFRSEPYQSPAVRPVEWTFDLADPQTNIVGPARKLTADTFDAINWWRFIRDGLTAQPSEGAGFYTVDRRNGAGKRPKVERLTAADQASLVAQGDAIVDQDTRQDRTLDISVGPFPVLGHFDVTQVQDPTLGNLKAVTRSHVIPLDGADPTLTLEVL